MSKLTRQFARKGVQHQEHITSLSEFVIKIRKFVEPLYNHLSRKQKKQLFGTVRNPSKSMVSTMFCYFTRGQEYMEHKIPEIWIDG